MIYFCNKNIDLRLKAVIELSKDFLLAVRTIFLDDYIY